MNHTTTHTHGIKIFSCRGSRYLAEKIAKSLGLDLGDSIVTDFSDGEFQPAFNESVRGTTTFIVQSTFPPLDNLFELRPRVSIGAKLVANLLVAAGCDRVITTDLHADQIQGFFDFPVDHIYASTIFLPYLRDMQLDNLSIAAPDMGGAKRANAYSRVLGCPMIICHKSRERPNVVGSMTAIGDVEGRNIVIIDDMIDTAGTITKAADMLMEKGALSVRAMATHPVFSGQAYERINKSALQEVVVTDTIPLRAPAGTDLSKFTVLSVADMFAEVIDRIYNYKSISDAFGF